MKKLFLLIALFTFFVGQSQEWKLIFELPKGKYFYKPNNDETAWIKIISDKTEYYPGKTSLNAKTVDGHTLILWKFDCTSKKIGIVKSTVYNTDGEVLQSYSQRDILVEMDYVNPDSVGEGLLNVFCKG